MYTKLSITNGFNRYIFASFHSSSFFYFHLTIFNLYIKASFTFDRLTVQVSISITL